jgi:hypothetical protein
MLVHGLIAMPLLVDCINASGRSQVELIGQDPCRFSSAPVKPSSDGDPAKITADRDTVAVVVMPELIFTGLQRLLHNQRALYVKRLLHFEPHVILTTVPYRLT